MFCSGYASESINLSLVTIWHSLSFPAGVSLLIPIWKVLLYLTLISDLLHDPTWCEGLCSPRRTSQTFLSDPGLKHRRSLSTCKSSQSAGLCHSPLQWLCQCYSLVALKKLFEKFGFRCGVTLMWVARLESGRYCPLSLWMAAAESNICPLWTRVWVLCLCPCVREKLLLCWWGSSQSVVPLPSM